MVVDCHHDMRYGGPGQQLISGVQTMTAQEAIKLVDAALENHWLNLHEGPFPEDQKDADEFEAAMKLVEVVTK